MQRRPQASVHASAHASAQVSAHASETSPANARVGSSSLGSVQHTSQSVPVPQVPPHLKPFVVEQHYHLYTAIDHAVWRYVIRQNSRALQGRSHEAYLNHFTETGMTLESIPNVERMNLHLEPRGWKAVTVDGFIPPGVFMDFQAHGLLPIAQDIRTLEHIAYTPAPDIIHEGAGHAPLILDPYFGQFLRYVGELGAKAIGTREDHEVYEAIRNISIQKEDPHATPEQVRAAELRLEAAMAANVEVSEAAELSRLYWWTVEYGLIGTLEDPRIYGAGLCSSMSEGGACLDPSVRKVPFDLSCIEVGYDITRPQPQLFVTDSFERLVQVTEAFAERMAFKRGGTASLQKAVRSGKVCTAVYESGLQVSGVISALILGADGEAVAFMTEGPSEFAVSDQELEGMGPGRFPMGLCAPIGRLRGFELGMATLPDQTLAAQGIAPGQSVVLSYVSGIEVSGQISELVRRDGKLMMLLFSQATVRLNERILFDGPSFALPLDGAIVSVFSGTADKINFVVERHPSPVVNLRTPQTAAERELEQLYAAVRAERERLAEQSETTGPVSQSQRRLLEVASALEQRHPNDWLLRVELMEILVGRGWLPELQDRLLEQLKAIKTLMPERATLITNGLAQLFVVATQVAA